MTGSSKLLALGVAQLVLASGLFFWKSSAASRDLQRAEADCESARSSDGEHTRLKDLVQEKGRAFIDKVFSCSSWDLRQQSWDSDAESKLINTARMDDNDSPRGWEFEANGKARVDVPYPPAMRQLQRAILEKRAGQQMWEKDGLVMMLASAVCAVVLALPATWYFLLRRLAEIAAAVRRQK